MAEALTTTNPGFEDGNLTGWTTIGLAAVDTSNPASGSFHGVINSGGSVTGTPFTSGTPYQAENGSAMMTTITGTAGEVVSFRYNFMTREYVNSGADFTFNDTAFVVVSKTGTGTVLRQVLASVAIDLPGTADGEIRQTGYRTFSYTLPLDGTYTIGFGVVNAGDATYSSALQVDDQLTNNTALGTFPPLVLPPTIENFSAASVADGSVDAFFGFPLGTIDLLISSQDPALNIDFIPPVVTVPANIVVVGSGGGEVVTYSAPTATDNVGVVSLTQTSGLASGSTFPVGTTTNVFQATDAAGNAGNASFTVTITGLAPEIVVFDGGVTDPQLTDNTGTQDFGSVNTGSSSAAQTLTIRNDGTADLTGIAVTKAVTGNPGDFTVNTAGMLTTLAPNATTSFTVTFAPTAGGSRSAVVEVASNDGDENPFEIQVVGTGVAVVPLLPILDAGPTAVLAGLTATPFTQGTEFTLPSATTVTALGFIDPEANGLAFGHEVAIWTNTGTLVAGPLTIVGSDPAVPSGMVPAVWRVKALAVPVALNAGTYRIGALLDAGYVDKVLNGAPTAVAPVTRSSGYVRNEINTPVFGFPNQSFGAERTTATFFTGTAPVSGPLVFTGLPITITGSDYIADGNDVPTREMNFTPTPGQSYTYIEVTGAANDIIGTFNDLPDGGVIAMNYNGVIHYFQVNYNGGVDGNDLIFTNFTPSGPPAWTWTAGPKARNGAGIFGDQGSGAPTNNPGARQGAMQWLDEDGSLWMFGGYGYGASVTSKPRYLNDLWQYDRVEGQWIWQGGATTANAAGVYGTQGMEDSANMPGARHTGSTWRDARGFLWLFGGFGPTGRRNDLWVFNPNAAAWTWVAGANTVGQAGVYGTQGTADPANTPGARQGAVTWFTPEGSDGGDGAIGTLWLFGGTNDGGTTNFNDLWRFDIGSGEWTWVSGSSSTNSNGTYAALSDAGIPSARRDATAWIANDGTLWLFGGRGLSATGPTLGDLSDVWRYNTATNVWTWISGPSTHGAAGTYTALNSPGIPAARSAGSGWTTVDGKFWLVGGFQNSADPLNDVWIYNPATNVWTWKLGSSTPYATGTYGTLGEASAANQPSARFTPSTWVTLNGDLWLFGGGGMDGLGGTGRMSDLWSYGIPNPVGAPYEPIPEPFPDSMIVNDDPRAFDATAETMAYVPVSGQLTGFDADRDPLYFSAAGSTLSQGNLTLNADGTWTYVPAAGFTGSTAFQFKASDNYGGESAVRTLVITVSTNLADSDGDGIADGYEYQQWGSLATADGDGDADLDGQSNYFEFLAGTDPLDANERLATAPSVAGTSSANGTIKLSLTHVRPGVNYHLETSSDLDEWTRLGTFTFSVAGAAEIEDPAPATGAPKFYRMNLEATPAVILP